MNCPFCGYENTDDATNCASCGAPLKPRTDQGIPTADPPDVPENIQDASLPGEEPVVFDVPPEQVRDAAPPVVQVYDSGPAVYTSGPAVPPPGFEPGAGSLTVKKSNSLVWILIAVAVVLVCACSACALFSVFIPVMRRGGF